MKIENIRNSKGLICGKENKKIFSKYNTFNNSFYPNSTMIFNNDIHVLENAIICATLQNENLISVISEKDYQELNICKLNNFLEKELDYNNYCLNISPFGLIDLDYYIINSSDEFSEEIIYNIFKAIFIMFEKFENKHFSEFYKKLFYDLIMRGKIHCKENNESFLNFLEDLYLHNNLLLNSNKKYKDFSHFLTTLEQLYIKNYTKNSIDYNFIEKVFKNDEFVNILNTILSFLFDTNSFDKNIRIPLIKMFQKSNKMNFNNNDFYSILNYNNKKIKQDKNYIAIIVIPNHFYDYIYKIILESFLYISLKSCYINLDFDKYHYKLPILTNIFYYNLNKKSFIEYHFNYIPSFSSHNISFTVTTNDIEYFCCNHSPQYQNISFFISQFFKLIIFYPKKTINSNYYIYLLRKIIKEDLVFSKDEVFIKNLHTNKNNTKILKKVELLNELEK